MPGKRVTANKPCGYASYTEPGGGGAIEFDTMQCVHCGGHWEHKPGSGNIRGWCMNCNGPICGPRCQECVPWEKALDIMEGSVDPGTILVGGFTNLKLDK